MPSDHLTFLCIDDGQPFTPKAFGRWFAIQCEAAGVPSGLAAHGLRKAGAARLAEHGATTPEIMAWGGWLTLREAERYTRGADRKRLALQAAAKLKAGTELPTARTRFAKKREKA